MIIHIFISYSRNDMNIAEQIVAALAENELDTWIDWKSIPKGEEWVQEIYRGIEEAEVFLFLISPESVQSEWCNKEIDHAVKNGKRILPVVIQKPDDTLVHKEVAKINYIFYRVDKFNEVIEEIEKAIHSDYEWVQYHHYLQELIETY